jgi:hypothetical protein
MDTKNDDRALIMLAAFDDMTVARHDFTELTSKSRVETSNCAKRFWSQKIATAHPPCSTQPTTTAASVP